MCERLLRHVIEVKSAELIELEVFLRSTLDLASDSSCFLASGNVQNYICKLLLFLLL